MLKYIIKRLALSVFILAGVSLIIYVLIRCMPVNFIQQKIDAMNQGGATVPQETVDALMKLYGLEDNRFLGILKGYVNWLAGHRRHQGSHGCFLCGCTHRYRF